MDTLFTGRKTIELETVHSTNSYALELLKETILPEGTVVIARNQVSGRGQPGNKWESEPGKNLTLSFIFYPVFLPVEKQFILSKVVSLAVAELLVEVLGKKVHIKWPNDIYVDDKKIAGLLIENILRQNRIASCVAGIGLNVNQETFSVNAGKTVSIKNILGKEADLKLILEKLCSNLEVRYLQLRSGKHEILDRDYLHLLYRLNVWANYNIDGEVSEGKISGVKENGKLLVEMRGGEKREFNAKQIVFVH